MMFAVSTRATEQGAKMKLAERLDAERRNRERAERAAWDARMKLAAAQMQIAEEAAARSRQAAEARRMYASQAMMREKPEKTVPTISPFDFDLEFNPAHPSPDVPMNRDAGRTPTSEEKFKHARRYPALNPGVLFNADAA